MKPSGRTVSAGAGSNRHSGALARLGLEKSGSRYIGLLWEKGRRANRLPKRRDGSQKEGRGARLPSAPARNLTPVPSPIALPPSGRGERGWSGGARRKCFRIGNAMEKHPIGSTASAKSPSPGRREGDGRGDRGEVRPCHTPPPAAPLNGRAGPDAGPLRAR